MEDDPISTEEAAIMIAVIDMIEPDTALTAEHIHQQLVAEMSDPPTLGDVRNAVAILQMPHLGYRPGESSTEVLDRMRAMLDRAEPTRVVDLAPFQVDDRY
ncbi:hypothetical protein ACFVH4_19200 [Nocardia ignorata]|uniref:hypothetical protein n=1 Tax=Nocardia ignorata TaxID=145285 RepID=UPI00363CEB43